MYLFRVDFHEHSDLILVSFDISQRTVEEHIRADVVNKFGVVTEDNVNEIKLNTLDVESFVGHYVNNDFIVDHNIETRALIDVMKDKIKTVYEADMDEADRYILVSSI